MSHWSENAVFYHLYPLGFCGAPKRNDQLSAPVNRLQQIIEWFDHLQSLGINALYIGPLFESTAHGYDTIDYFRVDRRLGETQDLKKLCQAAHARGMRVVLDGVLNHVGRDFHGFQEVRARKAESPFAAWFANINFHESNGYQDGFSYEGWNGYYDLVKLNLRHPEVIAHLLSAVQWWMNEFEIDGLRLDAAECMDLEFLKTLTQFCKKYNPEFWLMGEAVHGDYRTWSNPAMLDSMTNYECYKGLYSSFNDKNLFEIEFALTRQYGEQGIYKNSWMYNFVDNHDVDRIASTLVNPQQLYALYCLLFTMPGIPSLYYGSEWGLKGKKTPTCDDPLRPARETIIQNTPEPDLIKTLQQLIQIRKTNTALQTGRYATLLISSEVFVFTRLDSTQQVIVIINISDQKQSLSLALPDNDNQVFHDTLNQDEMFTVENQVLKISESYSHWARILICETD